MIIKHMFLILGGLAGAAAAISTHAANAANMQKMDAGSASIVARPDFQHREMKIPASFLGISVEYGNIPTFFSPVQLPLTARLLNRLGRLQGPPVLRIGGNSEDRAVWNLRSVRPLPPGDHINLSSATAAMLRAAAEATGGKLILGINFGRGTPAMAAPWIRCALANIGVGHIMAFEIGNEPDIYNHHGTRPRSYTLENYLKQWHAFADAIDPMMPRRRMLAGPAFCASWRRDTPEFIRLESSRLAVVTMHEYPLGAPIKNRRSPKYPSIANLLTNSSADIYASLIRPSVATGRRYGIPVRFAEINSAYAGGKEGVSNTFAETLWSLDTMFEIASTGAAGVNFHTGPHYGAFWSFHSGSLQVLPLYYGMLMFAQAAPPGAELIPIAFHSRANVKLWMTLDRRNTARIVMINKDLHRNVTVRFSLPASSGGRLERLTAASVTATTGIDIGGITFSRSGTGVASGRAQLPFVHPRAGVYSVTLPHCSAAMLIVQLHVAHTFPVGEH